MAGIWLPSHRIAQPRSFAKANPKWLEKGLVALFDLGQMVEVLSGARPTSITGTPTIGRQGRGVKFAGSGSVIWAHQPQFAVLGPLSIFPVIDVTSLANYSGIISKEATATTYAPYEFRLGNSATDAQFNLLRAAAGSYASASATSSVLAAGFSGTIGITHVQSATVGPINYTPTNQSQIADASTLNVTPADNGASVYIGSRASGTVFFNGTIYLVPVFNQALSPADAAALLWDIWDLYAPEQVFVPSTGGGTSANQNLTGASSTSSAGSLGYSASTALTGVASTSTAGAISATAGTSTSLTGAATTSSAGAISDQVAEALTGASTTSAAGTLIDSPRAGLTGAASTSAAGALTDSIGEPLIGAATTSAAGSVSASSSSGANFSLAGVSGTTAPGVFVDSLGEPILGATSATAAGVLTAQTGIFYTLAGAATTSTAGSVADKAGQGPAGASTSSSAGVLNPQSGIVINVPGVQSVTSAGALSKLLTEAWLGASTISGAGVLSAPSVVFVPAQGVWMVDARPPFVMVDARPPFVMVDARPPFVMVEKR